MTKTIATLALLTLGSLAAADANAKGQSATTTSKSSSSSEASPTAEPKDSTKTDGTHTYRSADDDDSAWRRGTYEDVDTYMSGRDELLESCVAAVDILEYAWGEIITDEETYCQGIVSGAIAGYKNFDDQVAYVQWVVHGSAPEALTCFTDFSNCSVDCAYETTWTDRLACGADCTAEAIACIDNEILDEIFESDENGGSCE